MARKAGRKMFFTTFLKDLRISNAHSGISVPFPTVLSLSRGSLNFIFKVSVKFVKVSFQANFQNLILTVFLISTAFRYHQVLLISSDICSFSDIQI